MSEKPESTTPPKPAPPLADCAGPQRRAWPDQFLSFQRQITSTGDPAEDGFPLWLECWATSARLTVSVLAEFAQQWTLKEVLVGDHATTVTLAPGEILTLEVRRTERTLLEENREQSEAVEAGVERGTTDKESINVAATSARSANWSVSGGGSFSMGGIGASASATTAGTVTSSLASTVDEVHETTVKSARKVTTQSKIQVRGVSEDTTENRQTRILRNPYRDRALGLNLYEINKRFQVRTAQDRMRPLVTAEIKALDLGTAEAAQSFIAANAAFLAETLIDPDLRTALPTVVESVRDLGARLAQRAEQQKRLERTLDDIEEYLFGNRAGWQPYHHANYVEDIIAATVNGKDIGAFTDASDAAGQRTASIDAENVNSDALQLFLTLHSAYTLRTAAEFSNAEFRKRRFELFTALARAVKQLWTTGLDAGARMNLLNRDAKTELFRRIPGFLYLADGLLATTEAPQPDDPRVVALTTAMAEHLRCHRHYYTEQYLRFLWDRLGRTFVVRLVNSLLYEVYNGFATPPVRPEVEGYRPYRNLYRVEEVQRDGPCVLIPMQTAAILDLSGGGGPSAGKFADALKQLAQAIQGATSPAPRTDEVLVAADGVHLEPVAGACVLEDVPREKTGCCPGDDAPG